MNRTSLYYLVIVLTIFGLIFNWLSNPSTSKQKQSQDLPFKSDYFIENVTIKYFDENGQLENQLKASKLEHFKWNQTSLITQPLIEVKNHDKNNKQSSWQITASHGYLDHSENQIMLHDTVEIKQSSIQSAEQPTSDNGLKKEANIKTANLFFDLNNNFAQTQNDVTIEINSLTTIAKTMYIDFEQARVDLKGITETTGLLND